MIIRNARIEDVSRLREVKPVLDIEKINRRLEEQDGGRANFLIVEENGEIVSFVYLKFFGSDIHPDYPDIEDLFTKESERGRGFASMLIRECEKLAKERGFKKIGLAVNPDLNNSARKLYEYLGFHNVGEKPYVDAVYDGVKDWCIDMVKRLS